MKPMQDAPVAPPLKTLARDAGASRSYYSVAEVAALLAVSRVTVWRWISSGKLPVSRLGHRTVRIKREDLASMPRSSGGSSNLAMPPSATGLVAPAGLRSGAADHFVLFYDADPYLVDGIADFIGPALQGGERAIVVATAAHRIGIADRLQTDGIDVRQALTDGQYTAVDAAQTLARFMVDDLPDATRFDEVLRGLISSGATGRPRIFGEMVALLLADGKPAAALALEELWNVQAKKRPFALMCGYPMQQLGGVAQTTVLVDVCSAHSAVIPTESYSALDGSDARLRAIAALQQKAASLEREVAERRRVEEQLQVALAAERAARAEVEAALRMREEFLSIASHELRTPVTVLRAQVQLSQRRLERNGELEPERLRQALGTMGSQSDKLGRLVGQLLDVSRLGGGKLHLERHTINLVQLVDQVVSASFSLTHKHSIGLTAPAVVDCDVDPLRIEQVLTNLIDNAIKYSPDGGSVDVAVAQAGPHHVEVSVRDYGVGIPVDKRERIFERFYQAHDNRGGMGLGLYVSSHIVELHGGEMRAEFPPQGGTRMIVRLPLANFATHTSAAAD